MKFCLSNRQDKEYLMKADQIKVQFRDRKSIPDLIMDYPGKEIILENPKSYELEWDELQTWRMLAKDNFVLCLSDPDQLVQAIKLGFKAYFGWTISDYEVLNTVLKMGVCYVRVSGPLFFDLGHVDGKIRATANIAFEDGLIREDGVAGTYIRPEDVNVYDEYIDVIEFGDCDLKKEQALYRIYAEQKAWPGDLGMLITDLNHVGVNRMVHPHFAQQRISCRQRCQSGGACRVCYRLLDLANPDLFKDINIFKPKTQA